MGETCTLTFHVTRRVVSIFFTSSFTVILLHVTEDGSLEETMVVSRRTSGVSSSSLEASGLLVRAQLEVGSRGGVRSGVSDVSITVQLVEEDRVVVGGVTDSVDVTSHFGLTHIQV